MIASRVSRAACLREPEPYSRFFNFWVILPLDMLIHPTYIRINIALSMFLKVVCQKKSQVSALARQVEVSERAVRIL